MTQDDLGHRLSVTKQAVRQLEVSEADDSIRLGTLRRAAEALDATLVYALVPNSTLDDTVERRARVVAQRDVERAGHTMLLEDQPGGAGDADRLVADLAAAAKNARGLWRDS
jgi:predicted DNA-binding mobile mystery protein A